MNCRIKNVFGHELFHPLQLFILINRVNLKHSNVDISED